MRLSTDDAEKEGSRLAPEPGSAGARPVKATLVKESATPLDMARRPGRDCGPSRGGELG